MFIGIFICVIIGTIYFILLDELTMAYCQKRIGPLNLGIYGILTAIINGCNLMIQQFMIPKHYLHYDY